MCENTIFFNKKKGNEGSVVFLKYLIIFVLIIMKHKVINDPVHGFISINNNLVYQIIEHPYFQRLRRIKQLGLTDLVYPGALHTRFHHAIGAYHLMRKAITTLQSKGVEITDDESLGAQVAILLHDIGHGPFSHTLEHSLIKNVSHEHISMLYMEKLNQEFNGQLDLAIQIFTNKYHKKFLHQLVSGQLDVDRLDYLTRDSFFTGVSEGVINYNRLIDMMDVADNEMVVEAKGIYSVEKFLISRRIMYWQVYLHKTVLCAEEMLIKIIKRAQYLSRKGMSLPCSNTLLYFLENNIDKKDFIDDEEALIKFSNLDDIDILAAVKSWMYHEDEILSFLCESLMNRKLFKIKIQDKEIAQSKIESKEKELMKRFNINKEEVEYLVIKNKITSYLYNPSHAKIKILNKKNKVEDFTKANDQFNALSVERAVSKFYFCYPTFEE